MSESKYIALGSNLKALRKEKGLSQIALAKILGVTNKAVSAWEVGVADPRKETLDEIIRFFGTDKNTLCYGDVTDTVRKAPSPETLSPALGVQSGGLQLEDIFSQLNPDNQLKLLQKAKLLLKAQYLEDFDRD